MSRWRLVWWRPALALAMVAPVVILAALLRTDSVVVGSNVVRGRLLDLQTSAWELRAVHASLAERGDTTDADIGALRRARVAFLQVGQALAADSLVPIPDVSGAYLRYAAAVDDVLVSIVAGVPPNSAHGNADLQYAQLNSTIIGAQRAISAGQSDALARSQRQAFALSGVAAAIAALILLAVFRKLTVEQGLATAAAVALRTEERFRALTDHSSDIVWTLNQEGVVAYASPSTARLLGHDPALVVGSRLALLVHAEQRAALDQFVRQLQENPASHLALDCQFAKGDGETADVELVGRNLLDHPDVKSLVLNGRDVTERNRAAEHLRQETLHDRLTGLPNRTLLLERITAALVSADAKRRHSFGIAYFDLDGFKTVNDVLGHAAGDELLRQVALRASQVLRIPERDRVAGAPIRGPRRAPAADTLARIGGDEFAALLHHIEHPSGTLRAAERIQEALVTPFDIGGREVRISASVGITIGPGGYRDAAEMIRDADIAMYRAKTSGQPHPQIFDQAMHDEMAARLQLENELRAAIEREEFVLHFQPIFSLRPQTLQGFEALVRWRHPIRGLLAPGQFLKSAEDTRLILPLGRWVLREACRQTRRWLDREPGLPAGVMSVNLSALEMMQPDALANLSRVLSDAGVPPQALRLEVTETVAMRDPEVAVEFCRAARELGVSVGVDDFGTGYCSLAYLRRLEIDFLKVDRSLLEDAGQSGRSHSILTATGAMAAALNVEVVYEGIERPEQLQLLGDYERTLIQGYHLGAPMPEVDTWTWLRSQSRTGSDPIARFALAPSAAAAVPVRA